MSLRHSVELLLLSVLDTEAAVPFYEKLGLRVVTKTKEEAVLEGSGLQLVLAHADALDPDDGRPRAEFTVTIEVLEQVWQRDERDDPTLPGPTLSRDGAFEYRARDPSGNRIRILAPLPDPDEP